MNTRELEKKYCVDFRSIELTSKLAKKKLQKHSFCVIKNVIHQKEVNYLFDSF